jgi:hypothetical protein
MIIDDCLSLSMFRIFLNCNIKANHTQKNPYRIYTPAYHKCVYHNRLHMHGVLCIRHFIDFPQILFTDIGMHLVTCFVIDSGKVIALEKEIFSYSLVAYT